MSALGPADLVLCAGSVPPCSFRERVAAAAAAGFAGLSLSPPDYRRAREEGLSDADLRHLLGDHGLAIAELDPLLRWIPDAGLDGGATPEGVELFRSGEDEFYAIADALGARSLNAVVYSDAPIGPGRLAEAFAGLCDRAAPHGLLVHLEFLPWTRIPSLAAARAVVEAAGRPNGGIMLDSWHHFRGGGSSHEIRALPGARISGVQINDAPARALPDPVQETLRRRLLPGEGDIDLVGLVRSLDAIGCRAPIGVEVFSQVLAARPVAEVAAATAAAARAVLARARS